MLHENTPKKRTAKMVGCSALVAAIFIVFGGLVWLGPRLVFGPSLWKTTIGVVEIPGRGKLEIGRSHDGDVSYEYFVRVKGATDGLGDWRYVASSLYPEACTESALTADSRFAAVSFDSGDGMVEVIYDSISKELWWETGDRWSSTSKFQTASRLLHAINPRLSGKRGQK